METLIEFSNYSFSYKGAKVKAVEDVSFKISRGEYVSIIGPTGAGKTTLCRSVVGLIPSIYTGKITGEINVLGKPITSYHGSELSATIGYVHQDVENLGIPREEIKKRIDDALHLVHLEDYRTRHPFYLSGGQRQRVVLATALAMNPDILILDEATSEIDPLGAEEIMVVTKELNDIGKTIIMIEHNMEEVSRFTNRTIVLDKGHVLANDTTEAVLTNLDLMDNLNIYPPEVTQLFMQLRRRGAAIDEIPMTVDGAIEKLRALLKKTN